MAFIGKKTTKTDTVEIVVPAVPARYEGTAPVADWRKCAVIAKAAPRPVTIRVVREGSVVS
jgi:hypothetical protein